MLKNQLKIPSTSSAMPLIKGFGSSTHPILLRPKFASSEFLT